MLTINQLKCPSNECFPHQIRKQIVKTNYYEKKQNCKRPHTHLIVSARKLKKK